MHPDATWWRSRRTCDSGPSRGVRSPRGPPPAVAVQGSLRAISGSTQPPPPDSDTGEARSRGPIGVHTGWTCTGRRRGDVPTGRAVRHVGRELGGHAGRHGLRTARPGGANMAARQTDCLRRRCGPHLGSRGGRRRPVVESAARRGSWCRCVRLRQPGPEPLPLVHERGPTGRLCGRRPLRAGRGRGIPCGARMGRCRALAGAHRRRCDGSHRRRHLPALFVRPLAVVAPRVGPVPAHGRRHR